jgi:phosphoribosylamine--glycine ligase
MRILIVGSGGREHALAWKIAQSPRLSHLYVAPGNAGTSRLAENVPVQANDIAELVAFANRKDIDLVIVGPEVPLAAGLADALRDAGRKVFGPSRAAAYIESSKAFAKALWSGIILQRLALRFSLS